MDVAFLQKASDGFIAFGGLHPGSCDRRKRQDVLGCARQRTGTVAGDRPGSTRDDSGISDQLPRLQVGSLWPAKGPLSAIHCRIVPEWKEVDDSPGPKPR